MNQSKKMQNNKYTDCQHTQTNRQADRYFIGPMCLAQVQQK